MVLQEVLEVVNIDLAINNKKMGVRCDGVDECQVGAFFCRHKWDRHSG
jgi:hypothetical protein